MKKVLLILTLFLTGCDYGLKKELDIKKAELVIKKFNESRKIDSILLRKSNAEHIINIEKKFLFVVNSFNSDFNGVDIYNRKR
ncbi:hypothetical protein RCC89_11350 [Cytophagaceae bacterium ABcell3]|nr:hypothetical protein RCC89_11350 [Cytophagaceae bacterium ABcell3]